MSREIISYLKNADGKKFKIELESIPDIIGKDYWYHILYSDGDRFASDFKSKDAAIRYLESKVGSVREY